MKIVTALKNKMLFLFNLSTFIKYELKTNNLGLVSFIKTVSKGFYSISGVLYNFEENDYKDYISDWKRIRQVSKINGDKRLVLDDMLLYHLFNKDNPKVPKLIAITNEGKLFEISDSDSTKEISIEKFLDKAKLFPHGVIVKSQRGGGGANITKVQFKDNEFIFSGTCKSYDAFEKAINSSINFIVTEIINQTGFANEVYPKSLNTIRVLTMIDPETMKPFIAKAVQRFGTVDSEVVDNWTAGGISVDINIEKGVYGLGASYPKNKKVDWLKEHPNTKVKFFEESVPNWNLIKESVLKMSSEYFFLSYIGWDIVPMEDGFLVLEGNTNSDVNLLQIHGGLLKNKRVREFYKYHNSSV